jgi:TonB-linked SusC/RagA family outer membrane protein
MENYRQRKYAISTPGLPVMFFFLLFLLAGTAAFSQQAVITGKVTDEQGETLSGVSVVIKNTTSGTMTDLNGDFKISVPNENAVLSFSYLGYAGKETGVRGRKVVNVVLQEDTKILDEIVVVGYGEMKRQDLTGSVGSVKTADLQKAPVRSFEEAMGGRIAGVRVTSPEGTPGEGMNIVVRGNNSITQENSPLYVIDGFPMEDFNANTLNPSDVESIDVLKDASATAIYGARGANGVVMITTRRGKEGRPQLNFDAWYGIQTMNKRMDLMGAFDFVSMQWEFDQFRTTTLYLRPDASDNPTLSLDAYRNMPSIDWQDRVLQDAPIQNYTLSLSGGTKATRYSLSLNFFNQEGLVVKSGFDRYQGRLRLDQEVSDKLKMGININYSQTKQYGTAMRFEGGSDISMGLLYNMWGYRPVNGSGDLNKLLESPEDDEIVAIGGLGSRYNPLQYINNEARDIYQNSAYFNVFLEYQFSRYLKLKVAGGSNAAATRSETFFNSRHPSAQLSGGVTKGVNGSESFNNRQSLLNENTLTYARTFNRKHSFNAMGAFTVQTSEGNTFGGMAYEVPRESLGVSGLEEGKAQPLSASKTKNALMSYLARLNYNCQAKYYATFSFRADGSSKFPKDSRWSYFPSGSVAWRLSRETFFPKKSVFSDAKIRASYGITGNNRIGDFVYLPQLDFDSSLGYSQNNELIQGGAVSNLGNNMLQWERTKAADVGIDLGLWNQRLTIIADWYRKKTENLLLNANLPPSSGFTRAIQNIGAVQNSGLEIAVGTVNIKNRKFRWTTDFNISRNRSKVLGLANGEQEMLTNMGWNNINYNAVPLYMARVGDPIAQFYGFVWDGNYQIGDFNWQNNSDPSIPHAQRTYVLKDDVPDNGLARNQIKPGYVRYKDMPDRDGNTDGHIDNNDRVVIGDPNPDFEGGLTNNFTYMGFDLNIFFHFSVGNDIFNANRLAFEGTYRYGLNQFASYSDRWSPENPDSPNYVTGGGGNSYYSTRTIEDGSFIRLKTVQLGYNFSAKQLKYLGIQKLKIYASAQNLFTLTPYSGWDPEVSIRNSALTPGFDYSAYPRNRTYVFGLNVTF